jgi:hypothetical protein
VAVPIAGKAGVAFYMKAKPLSVYVAFPDSKYQIEVYSPTPKVARHLVAAGRVTQVG